jgi:hypothetical protein
MANLYSAADALMTSFASYPRTATDAFVRGKVCVCWGGVVVGLCRVGMVGACAHCDCLCAGAWAAVHVLAAAPLHAALRIFDVCPPPPPVCAGPMFAQDFSLAVCRTSDAVLAAAFPSSVPPYALCVVMGELMAWVGAQVAAWTSHPGLSGAGVSSL